MPSALEISFSARIFWIRNLYTDFYSWKTRRFTTLSNYLLSIFNYIVQTCVHSIPYLKKTHLMGRWFLHMQFLTLYECAFTMHTNFDQIWYLIELIIITSNDRHFFCPIIWTDIYLFTMLFCSLTLPTMLDTLSSLTNWYGKFVDNC